MLAVNSDRAMTRVPVLQVRALLAAMLVSLLSACERADECVGGEFRCDGDVAMNCANIAGRNNDYNIWYSTSCGAGRCKLDSATNGAFCARDAVPEARCDEQRWGFCAGTSLTSCRAGYVVATKDCAASTPEAKVCVPLEHAQVGDTQPLNAMCASTPEPSPLCRSSGASDACDGDAVVVCQYGYEIARIACGAGLTCRPFGVCGK